MVSLNVVLPSAAGLWSDVAESQATLLANSPCQRLRQCAKVTQGRTQAAFASHEGCAIGHSGAPFQEYRSRGCRRARKLSWRCAWLPLWQPAPAPSSLKSFMWTNRFRSSQHTPANTNKSVGRAAGSDPKQPAPSTRSRCDATRFHAAWRALVGSSYHPAFLTSLRLSEPATYTASALGLTPSSAYGCAHSSNGGRSC